MAQPPETHLILQSADDGVKIVDVWAHNLVKELEIIRSIVRDFPIVAVTTSPDVAAARPIAATAAGYPAPDSTYDTLRTYIDDLCFYQVSLAFTNPGGDLARRRFWRFHIGNFDAGHLRFFVEMGVEVPARRVVAAQLGAALITFEMAASHKVVWVTCDGAADLACLLKCVFPALPHASDRDKFLRRCKDFFPRLYDLKVLAMHGEVDLFGAPGTLLISNAQAPSDSGETASAARVERYRGMLFGLNDGTAASYKEEHPWDGTPGNYFQEYRRFYGTSAGDKDRGGTISSYKVYYRDDFGLVPDPPCR